ncbi:hypothetical protein P4B35_21780 [Pontiellaceae bacterium B12227]|nr:hypothetical protein [Pontiellaceae bacterium B12227]
MAVGPLPPGGTPTPVLTGIIVAGPSNVEELTTAQYTCSGKYSDSTTAPITALWEINTDDASIDSSGLLSVGNISSDQNVTITASVGGYSESLDLVIESVAPVLTGISIVGPSTVNEEATAKYACNASYSDGTTLSVVPLWTVLSPSADIDASGNLIAGTIDSDELIRIDASFNGKTNSFNVTIIDSPVVLESLTISGSVSMDENTSIQLSCIGQYSDGTSPLVDPSWSVTPSYATIDANGLLRAGDVTADVGVTVSASLDGVVGNHSVLIKYLAPLLERIEIAGPSSVPEQDAASYTCTAYYDDGTSKAIEPDWSENSSYADVNSAGTLSTYDVQADQSLTLTASYEGKSDSVTVDILEAAPVLVSISIEGETEVDENTVSSYSCRASYSDGSSAVVDPVWSVTHDWALIDATGNLSVGEVSKDELVRIWASYGELDASVRITLKDVSLPVLLESLSISGVSELMEGAAASLTCLASYSDGSAKTVTPVWSVDSALASISADGVFEAGNVESNIVVEVMASFGDLDARHTISVAMVSTQIIYPLSGFEGKTVMAEILDYESGDWSSYGPSEGPEELMLEDLGTNKWYWISISESNTTSGAWEEIQANWFHM